MWPVSSSGSRLIGSNRVRGRGIRSSMTSSVSRAMRSTMWLTLIACEMWWMKKISQPTATSASSMAPVTVSTGTNGTGSERAAGSAAMQ